MNGNIITCGNNWIIYDKLDNVDDLKLLVSDADPVDYSEFTTASGGSHQRFFTTPAWKPSYTPKLPSSWDKTKTTYEDVIQKYLVHYGKFPFDWYKLSMRSAWTVTGNKGSYHTPHEHGRDYISSVIYTEVPNKEPTPDNGGIYFVLHADTYSQIYHPEPRLASFIPEEGMILIFPSWIIHGTLPQGDGIRTTVNFDLTGDPYNAR